MKKRKKTKPKPEAPKPLHSTEPDAAGTDLAATEIRDGQRFVADQKPIVNFAPFRSV